MKRNPAGCFPIRHPATGRITRLPGAHRAGCGLRGARDLVAPSAGAFSRAGRGIRPPDRAAGGTTGRTVGAVAHAARWATLGNSLGLAAANSGYRVGVTVPRPRSRWNLPTPIAGRPDPAFGRNSERGAAEVRGNDLHPRQRIGPEGCNCLDRATRCRA